jgi:hypothetical protein
MMSEKGFERCLSHLVEVLSSNLTGWTEENHENPNSE